MGTPVLQLGQRRFSTLKKSFMCKKKPSYSETTTLSKAVASHAMHTMRKCYEDVGICSRKYFILNVLFVNTALPAESRAVVGHGGSAGNFLEITMVGATVLAFAASTLLLFLPRSPVSKSVSFITRPALSLS